MVWYVFCFLLLFIGMRIYKINTYNDECLSLNQTLPIRGFLSLLIIFHHLAQRFPILFFGYPVFQNIGFLLVGIFLFYSGYGLVYSFLSKKDYMKTFVSKRIFSLYIALILVSIFTIFLQIGMGEKVSFLIMIREILGVTLVNGTYWYIWVLFLFYIVFYLFFSSFDKKKAMILYTFFLLFFSFFLITYKVEGYWFLSISGFLLGIWVGYFKEEVLSFLKKHYIFAFPNVCFIVSFSMLYVLGIKIPYIHEIFWYIIYLSFPIFISLFLLIVLLKCKIGNSVLTLLGTYSLEIYLLHPLGIKIANFIPIQNETIFILFTLGVTFFLSYLFHSLYKVLCLKIAK